MHFFGFYKTHLESALYDLKCQKFVRNTQIDLKKYTPLKSKKSYFQGSERSGTTILIKFTPKNLGLRASKFDTYLLHDLQKATTKWRFRLFENIFSP